MTDYNTILAGQVSFIIKRNDTVSAAVTLHNPNDNDTPYDLSPFTELTMQVKWHRGSDKFFAELTLTGGELTVSGVDNNVLTIDLPTDIKPGDFYYDIQTNTGVTILEGNYIIDQDGTRTTP